MAYGLPSRGQQDWDDELNNSMESLRGDVQSTAARAVVAASDAAYARNRADEVHTAVIGTADAATAGFINDNTSKTAQALSAAYAAKGQPRDRTFGTLKTLETGTHNAFAHAVIAPDGNTLVAWRKGTNHTPSNGDIYIARYTETGTVVTAPVKVLDHATYDYRDPCLLVLANGNVLMTFFAYDSTADDPIEDGVRASVSTDNGVTWSVPVVVDSAYTGGTGPFAAAAGPAIQLDNGHILVPTYGQTGGDTWQSARVSRSTDNGATWTDLAVIADEDDSPRHWQEPNITALDNGDLLAVIRTEGPSQTMWTATSTDNGATWTGHAEAFAGSGAPRLVVQRGFLYAVYRDITSGRPTQRASADSGVTWGEPLELPNLAGASPAKPSMVYGNAIAYGTDSLRYYYTLQSADTLTADLVTVDAIVPEDRGYRGPAGTRLRKSGTQAVNTATWTTLTFDTEDFDTDGFHGTTNPSRVSIPTGFSGYYQITGTVYMASSTAAQVQARILKNGNPLPGLRAKINPTSGGDSLVTASGLVYLTGGGDYIEIQAYQDSGGTVSARTEDTVLTVTMSAPAI